MCYNKTVERDKSPKGKEVRTMTNLLKNGYTVDLVDDGEITLAYVFRANGTYAFTANAEHADEVARILGLID